MPASLDAKLAPRGVRSVVIGALGTLWLLTGICYAAMFSVVLLALSLPVGVRFAGVGPILIALGAYLICAVAAIVQLWRFGVRSKLFIFASVLTAIFFAIQAGAKLGFLP